jgi:hypothetical protein
MGDVINLRQERKRAARRKAQDQAAENRQAHGASKQECNETATDREKLNQTLDQHRIEPGERR